MSEEKESNEVESNEVKVGKWVWIVLGIVVVAGVLWFVFGQSAPAKSAVDSLPTMVGGC